MTWLFAVRCLVCGERGMPGHDLCAACKAALPWQGPACPRCALPQTGSNPCDNCRQSPPPLQAVHAVFEELGADGYVYGTVAGLTTEEKLSAQQIVARVSARTPPQRGSVVKLSPRDPSSLHIFSPKTELRLN